MTNCHSGRDGVGVDDDVGRDPLTGEGHVLQNKTHPVKTSPPIASQKCQSATAWFLPPVCTEFHRFPSVHVDWQIYPQSEGFAPNAPVGETMPSGKDAHPSERTGLSGARCG